MSWSVWLMAAFGLFLFELLTPGGFFFTCLGVGALAGAISFSVTSIFWVPWLAFAVFSLISMYTIRPFARRLFQPVESKTNVDALIGQRALVTDAILPPALGTVKVEGEIWRAQASEPIEAGNNVEILAVKGTRLEVKKT